MSERVPRAGNRDAVLPQPWKRALGSAQRPVSWKNRQGNFLRGPWAHGAASRLHQKDAEDAGQGHGTGSQTQEGSGVESMAQKKKGKIGASFDGFLAEEGILETCEEQALKQILADQIQAAMKKDSLTKSAMAERMQTSRRALDRLLDPKNTGVTLHTLQR